MSRGIVRLKRMVKRRHKPISDSEIAHPRPSPARAKGGITTPFTLIRHYDVTDASVHDSRKFDGLLNQANTSSDVYADSAYRSAEAEAKLSLHGLRSRIRHRTNRNHPLSQAQEHASRQKCRVRARIGHVFGANRTRRVAGLYGRSESRGRKPKSACRTLPTTSAGW
jgi:IS5 family transposase